MFAPQLKLKEGKFKRKVFHEIKFTFLLLNNSRVWNLIYIKIEGNVHWNSHFCIVMYCQEGWPMHLLPIKIGIYVLVSHCIVLLHTLNDAVVVEFGELKEILILIRHKLNCVLSFLLFNDMTKIAYICIWIHLFSWTNFWRRVIFTILRLRKFQDSRSS